MGPDSTQSLVTDMDITTALIIQLDSAVLRVAYH